MITYPDLMTLVTQEFEIYSGASMSYFLMSKIWTEPPPCFIPCGWDPKPR